MAITVVSTASASGPVGLTNHEVPVPAGLQAGDVVVVAMFVTGHALNFSASGWQQIVTAGTEPSVGVFWRAYDPDIPLGTLGHYNAGAHHLCAVALRDADPNTFPLHAANFGASPAEPPDLTAAHNGSMFLSFMQFASESDPTPPAGVELLDATDEAPYGYAFGVACGEGEVVNPAPIPSSGTWRAASIIVHPLRTVATPAHLELRSSVLPSMPSTATTPAAMTATSSIAALADAGPPATNPTTTPAELVALSGNVWVAPPDEGETIVVSLAPVVSAPDIPGPLRVGMAGAVIPRLTATVFDRSDPTTPLARLDQALALQFRDEAYGVGSGSVELLNDDPDLPWMRPGQQIRFDLDGVPAMSILANEFDRTSITQFEEAGEATTISGPGLLSVLSEAVIFPSWGVGGMPLQEERSFGWTSVGYNYDSWGFAKVIANVRDWTPAWDSQREIWPDGHANWIWAHGATERLAKDGICYFLQEFYLDADTMLAIYAAGDDAVDIYLDGQRILEGHNWTNDPSDMLGLIVELEAGWHIVGAEVRNPGPPADIGGPFNPAGLVMSAHVIDADGNEDPTPVLWTDANWRVLPYPMKPPGMTPGRVIRMAVDEGKSRGGLEGVTLAFTDDTDTSGRPWDVGNWTTQVGTDVLTFLQEIAASDIDLSMSPASLQIQAWRKGDRGWDRGTLYTSPTDETDPATGNITQLNHREVM